LFYKAEVRVSLFPGSPFAKPRYGAAFLVSVERARIEKEVGKSDFREHEAVSAGAFAVSSACGDVVRERAKTTHADIQHSFLPSLVSVSPEVLKQCPVVSKSEGIEIRLLGEERA